MDTVTRINITAEWLLEAGWNEQISEDGYVNHPHSRFFDHDIYHVEFDEKPWSTVELSLWYHEDTDSMQVDIAEFVDGKLMRTTVNTPIIKKALDIIYKFGIMDAELKVV